MSENLDVKTLTFEQLAKTIDHSLLKPELTEQDVVENDIRAVVEAAGEGIIVKVILENCYLTDEEKVKACQLAEAAGADFVKTSTGFAASGATIEDLRLMRASVGPHVNVKAAHGVRTLEAALQVIEAGATRFGATRTKKILDDFKSSRGEGEESR